MRVSAMMVAATLSMLAVGCSNQNNLDEIRKLRSDLDEVKKKVTEVDNLATSDSLKVYFMESEKKAYLDPSTSTFSPVRTRYGVFFISVRKTSAKADGTIVTLDIGNQASAKFSDVLLNITYNTRRPQNMTLQQSQDWSAHQRTVKHKVSQDILSGTWNKVDVDLPGLPPDKLGHLEVEMESGTVALIGAQ